MLIFVRHGESEANVKGVFAGQRDDSVLTEKGKEQARITAVNIKNTGLKIDHIVASPLLRALETAKIIVENLGMDAAKIKVDQRIAEYDMGSLSGSSMKHMSSLALVAGEGAENPEKFRGRVLGCLREYKKIGGTTLFVSHAGVGRIIETLRDGMSPEYFYDLPAWQNASITEIDWI